MRGNRVSSQVNIMCRLCAVPVKITLACEELETGSQVVWVECHGSKDVVRLPSFVLHQDGEEKRIQQKSGAAFRNEEKGPASRS